jgi:regulator of sigma E protease
VSEIVQGAITIFLFFFILGSLVLVHELGHFITARLAGVRVLEFGIGFPPRAKVLAVGRTSEEDVEWAKRQREASLEAARNDPELTEAILDSEPEVPVGTLYTLNWLPIGGFVKLEGEDGDQADDPRSFVRARLPTKLIILVAGVAMNLVTAFLIFTVIALIATPFVGLRFNEIQPASPAAAAGLKPGEAIVAIDGQQFEFFGETQVLSDLRASTGETVELTLEDRDGTRRTKTVTLRPPEQIDAEHGPLGITAFESYFFGPYTGHDLATSMSIGASETMRWFGLILGGLGDLVSGFVSNPTAPPAVQGPVGIATAIGDVFFGAGAILTLYVAGILSANLALVNALPFPPLDGGRMLMIVLKALFGSRISLRAERLTYVVGFVFLFAFLIWVTGFDLIRILGGGAPE